MKARELELENNHIEFYDDCCVSEERSDEIYIKLGKYIRYVKSDIKKVDQPCINVNDRV